MLVKISGGNPAFKTFIRKCGDVQLLEFDTMEHALNNAVDCDAYIFLPQTNSMYIPTLSYECTDRLAILKNQGKRIYLEKYMSKTDYQKCITGYEALSYPNHVLNEVLVCNESLEDYFEGKAIFQARQHAYIPTASRIPKKKRENDPMDGEILMCIGRHFGTQRALDSIENDYIILSRTKKLYASMIGFSNYDPITMLPNYRYAQLFGYLFGRILNIEEAVIEDAFATCYKGIHTRMALSQKLEEDDKRDFFKETVVKAVRWHFDSGIVQDNFSYEMIDSARNELYNNKRVDAGLYTGWLLYAAGDYLGNREWMEKGKVIYDYFAENAQIKSGAFKGLYKWYLNIYEGPRCCFTIDCGRDGISLLNMYHLTKEQKYLDMAKDLADGFLAWINVDLPRAFCLSYNEDHSKDSHNPDSAVCTPDYCGDMGIFLMMAAEYLNDVRYSDSCIRIARRLVNEFPNYLHLGHTTSVQYARFIMLLAAVQNSGRADFSEMIDFLLNYLHDIQLPCGGIYAENNLSFERFGESGGNGENGIIVPWEDERISDQLYCVNNILVALSTLVSAKNTENIDIALAREMLNSLLEYTAKIQIDCEYKKFNGGWMRAFDINCEEYFGMDLDMFWGSYCIMAGWTMGMIPLSFLGYLKDECFYLHAN